MTDRELLEAAARAAGIVGGFENDGADAGLFLAIEPAYSAGRWTRWNSLTDDGDALRLENSLGLQVQWSMLDEPCYATVASYRDSPGSQVREFERLLDHGGDRGAARRLASTRAAAAIGSRAVVETKDAK